MTKQQLSKYTGCPGDYRVCPKTRVKVFTKVVDLFEEGRPPDQGVSVEGECRAVHRSFSYIHELV